MVVIGVVGVLSAGVIMVINPVKQMQRTRDSQRKADLKQMQTALELYRADVGSYPANLSCGGSLSSGSTIYINRAPCDPKSGWPGYAYQRDAVNTSIYRIRACLENDSDSDISTDGALSACSSGYKYGVYSP